MDQKRIGLFLKELRQEKQLTQEQLAQYLGVNRRTVSRWETGSNMPDLSLLVELADFYEVDMKDLINGKRKYNDMEQEKRETLLLVADYAENEKNILLQRLRIISFIGLCAISFIFITLVLEVDIELPVFHYFIGLCYGLTFGALMTTVLYSTGQLFKIRQYKKQKKIMKMVSIISLIICVILFVVSLLASI